MVIYTERSISTIPLCNSHRKPALWLLMRHDGTRHVNDVGVSKGSPAVNLNLQTVYNHMDTVALCSD